MSIQTIIDNASSITIDKQKVAAQTVSRSGHVLTAERASANPYRFVINVPSHLTYSENRGLLEELDRLDITVEEEINFGQTNSGLIYITSYQGGVTGGAFSCVGSSGNELYINSNSVSGSGTLFKAGDFIQPLGNTGTYRYPYQVTSDVSFVNSSNVTIPVHRPVIDQDGVSLTSGSVNYGINVNWFVKCQKKTAYTIVPHDRIQFSGSFELVEIIT